MKLYVEVKEARESKKKYCAMILDLEYRQALLTVDKAICAEAIEKPVAFLYNTEVGQKFEVKLTPSK